MTHTAARLGFGSILESDFGIDTLVVLFFLALEYGRAVRVFTMDGALMAITMGMVLALPYFLPSRNERPTIGNWFLVRGGFGFAGLVLGAAFGKSIGVVLPENAKLFPLTFLILASMISCYIQFYGLLRLRLAK